MRMRLYLADTMPRKRRTEGMMEKTMVKKLGLAVAASIGILSLGAADFLPVGMTGKDVQDAIDRAAKAGGGRIVLEPGTYPSSTVYLRSNVELHLKKGAVLRGSADWPQKVL